MTQPFRARHVDDSHFVPIQSATRKQARDIEFQNEQILQKLREQAGSDAATRRLLGDTQTIRGIIPSLHPGSDDAERWIPADRYYFPIGACDGTAGNIPNWFNPPASGNYQVWDATEEAFYFDNGDMNGTAAFPQFYYKGPFGKSRNHAPKDFGDVTKLILEFTMRFDNPSQGGRADYGFGMNSAVTGGTFAGSNHYFHIGSDGTDFLLATKDGTTENSVTGSAANSNWLDWKVEWSSTSVVATPSTGTTMTSSSNLPARPLRIHGEQIATPDTFEWAIMDFSIRWEK